MRTLIAPLFLVVCWGQGMNFNVDGKTAKLISLEDFDRGAFHGPGGKPLGPATVMLVNNSDQAIVALRAVWTTPNPQNPSRPRRNILTTDIFQAPNLRPLMTAHSRTVIGPGTVIASDGEGMNAATPGDAERHPGTSQTTVTIDAVVFENGALVGPDADGIAGDLQARKQAAAMVADKLRASGYSAKALDAVQFTPTSQADLKLSKALRDAADQAREFNARGMSLQAVEAWLRALPAPPQIFR